MCHFGDLPVVSQSRDPVMRLLWLHTSWVFFTLSHTQPLHYSHLNTGYLIAKIQANLARNKANTWLNKFNLTTFETLKDIMMACIILHNMIVEDERHIDILEQMTLIMIKSMIVDPNWCHIIPLVTLCSSLNVIIPLEIEEFILNFKWILSSIYGNYKARRRHLEF